MIFSSIFFVYFFLPCAGILFSITPKKARKFVLLLISCVYLLFSGTFALLIVFAFGIVNYIMLLLIYYLKKYRIMQSIVLFAAISTDIAFVAFARYHVFFGDFFRGGLAFLGASFCALNGIGTAIDVYNGDAVSINIVNYLLYILYFPKLLFGPFVAYDEFNSSLVESEYGLHIIGDGMIMFVKGLSRKVIVADSIFRLCSAVRSTETSKLSAISAWLGVIGFALYLYFTLLGIMEMASGISLLFGIRLPESFDYPLCCVGINEFCGRWHVTLIGWFKKYLCNSIDTNSNVMQSIVQIMMWCIIGVWYKADLNHLLWGAILGTASVFERMYNAKESKTLSSAVYAVLVLSAAWVILMHDNIRDCMLYLKSMLGVNGIADSTGIYLLRYYIVILLVAAYASCKLYKNVLERLRKSHRITVILDIATTIVSVALLIVCTTFMLHNNSNGVVNFF